MEQLGCGSETEVYNAPQYFIPASLTQYAASVQQQFLESSDDDEEEPTDTSVGNVPTNQSARAEHTVDDLIIEQPTEIVLPTETMLATKTVLQPETALRDDGDADLDAEIDDLFN